MAYTAEEIRDMALQRSDLNNEDLVPIALVLQYMSNFQRKIYLRAARLNPDYFGTDGVTGIRAAYTDGWDLSASPGNIAAVTRAEIANITGSVTGLSVGDRVNLVSLRFQNMEIAPRCIMRGKRLTPVGTELGAADANMVDQLTIYFSPLPLAIPSLSATVSLPEEWADLLVLPLAKVFAIRDGRLEEIDALNQEYADLRSDFDEAMLVFDHGLVRPLGSTPAIPIVPSG